MDTFGSRAQLKIRGNEYTVYRILRLQEEGLADIERLPFSIRILLENLLRKHDGKIVTEEDVLELSRWQKSYSEPREIAFYPTRVVMQDFTGIPGIVDLAAMRDTLADLGGSVVQINPLVPVDLVTDHSLQVDYFGSKDAVFRNLNQEYIRNGERYAVLKWAQKAFRNLRIFPPGAGIVHQVNLEYIARVITTISTESGPIAFPDTLVGTDSHTTMINGIGVLGWGVGGIEAEAVMLGQPYFMKIPEVVGVRLIGSLPERTTATDLVLMITELLRKQKVVEKFVEYFGPGVKSLSVPDRATLSNMSPEYGATIGYFPIDEKTIEYLRLTNRSEQAELVEKYAQTQGLFYTGEENPEFTEIIEFDLSTVEPCLAGPSRPQDRIPLSAMKQNRSDLSRKDVTITCETAFSNESGTDLTKTVLPAEEVNDAVTLTINGEEIVLRSGAVVIAAITSCTNTSNPSVLIGAGLIAKNAVERGLTVKPYVKTSFAPGSKVVVAYLAQAGLLHYLETLKFHVVGFGCTTCIGNSGPLIPEVEQAIKQANLVTSAVLSGNRNFEARIHQLVRANYLASPMLVVAFALAGRTDIDLDNDPLGYDRTGKPVLLHELWPSKEEIEHVISQTITPRLYAENYQNILQGDDNWQKLDVPEGETFQWRTDSTYIRRPPFFEKFSLEAQDPPEIKGTRVLLALGDSVTTDHISPAGSIPEKYPAGKYLLEEGISVPHFNSYGSRRGNHQVMIRGTFANIRIKNLLVDPQEGGYTALFPSGRKIFIFDAAMHYLATEIPLIVLAGKEYGTGSSRDWAAKGTLLLGVRAVIAESFERIHRNNLIGMGVLPLQFKPDQGWRTLPLTGTETFTISGLETIQPGSSLNVKAVRSNGTSQDFSVQVRLDTTVEVEYYKNGGILPFVLRKLARQ